MSQGTSSKREIPEAGSIPKHIAIIMDGNGRWARKRLMPRIAGHKQGIETVRSIIKACSEYGIKFLTLFAFSSENWHRPADEVAYLMQLFAGALVQEMDKLHENGICFKVIGDITRFEPRITKFIQQGEQLTANNSKLTLTIAANYGGRWDVIQAMKKMIEESPDLSKQFGEEDLTHYLSMHYAPEPDLFIRTGGEYRISNFLLWQLAYTELYFTDTLWPDFDEAEFNLAIQSYQRRERRFGRISEQIKQ